MSRKTAILAILVISPLAFGTSAVAQNPQNKPAPAGSGVVGPQLVVWSNVQKPEPLQQDASQNESETSQAPIRSVPNRDAGSSAKQHSDSEKDDTAASAPQSGPPQANASRQ